MTTYRKKPVEVDAFQYDGDFMFSDENYCIPDWAVAAFDWGDLYFDESDLYVNTLEGDMLVSVGDFIIKGIKDEIYPCKPDIFELTYEKVKQSNTQDFQEKVLKLLEQKGIKLNNLQ